MGTRLYGVCLTFYEKITPDHSLQLEQMIEEWRFNNLVPSDLEYVRHIQSQLAHYQDYVLKIKTGLIQADDGENIETLITDAEEKVNLYSDLLSPLKNTILADIDHVYAPKVIGVLSHWPWHDLLKDWLCELLKISELSYPSSDRLITPIER